MTRSSNYLFPQVSVNRRAQELGSLNTRLAVAGRTGASGALRAAVGAVA